jgi:hypothetical protein
MSITIVIATFVSLQHHTTVRPTCASIKALYKHESASGDSCCGGALYSESIHCDNSELVNLTESVKEINENINTMNTTNMQNVLNNIRVQRTAQKADQTYNQLALLQMTSQFMTAFQIHTSSSNISCMVPDISGTTSPLLSTIHYDKTKLIYPKSMTGNEIGLLYVGILEIVWMTLFGFADTILERRTLNSKYDKERIQFNSLLDSTTQFCQMSESVQRLLQIFPTTSAAISVATTAIKNYNFLQKKVPTLINYGHSFMRRSMYGYGTERHPNDPLSHFRTLGDDEPVTNVAGHSYLSGPIGPGAKRTFEGEGLQKIDMLNYFLFCAQERTYRILYKMQRTLDDKANWIVHPIHTMGARPSSYFYVSGDQGDLLQGKEPEFIGTPDNYRTLSEDSYVRIGTQSAENVIANGVSPLLTGHSGNPDTTYFAGSNTGQKNMLHMYYRYRGTYDGFKTACMEGSFKTYNSPEEAHADGVNYHHWFKIFKTIDFHNLYFNDPLTFEPCIYDSESAYRPDIGLDFGIGGYIFVGEYIKQEFPNEIFPGVAEDANAFLRYLWDDLFQPTYAKYADWHADVYRIAGSGISEVPLARPEDKLPFVDDDYPGIWRSGVPHSIKRTLHKEDPIKYEHLGDLTHLNLANDEFVYEDLFISLSSDGWFASDSNFTFGFVPRIENTTTYARNTYPTKYNITMAANTADHKIQFFMGDTMVFELDGPGKYTWTPSETIQTPGEINVNIIGDVNASSFAFTVDHVLNAHKLKWVSIDEFPNVEETRQIYSGQLALTHYMDGRYFQVKTDNPVTNKNVAGISDVASIADAYDAQDIPDSTSLTADERIHNAGGTLVDLFTDVKKYLIHEIDPSIDVDSKELLDKVNEVQDYYNSMTDIEAIGYHYGQPDMVYFNPNNAAGNTHHPGRDYILENECLPERMNMNSMQWPYRDVDTSFLNDYMDQLFAGSYVYQNRGNASVPKFEMDFALRGWNVDDSNNIDPSKVEHYDDPNYYGKQHWDQTMIWRGNGTEPLRMASATHRYRRGRKWNVHTNEWVYYCDFDSLFREKFSTTGPPVPSVDESGFLNNEFDHTTGARTSWLTRAYDLGGIIQGNLFFIRPTVSDASSYYDTRIDASSGIVYGSPVVENRILPTGEAIDYTTTKFEQQQDYILTNGKTSALSLEVGTLYRWKIQYLLDNCRRFIWEHIAEDGLASEEFTQRLRNVFLFVKDETGDSFAVGQVQEVQTTLYENRAASILSGFLDFEKKTNRWVEATPDNPNPSQTKYALTCAEGWDVNQHPINSIFEDGDSSKEFIVKLTQVDSVDEMSWEEGSTCIPLYYVIYVSSLWEQQEYFKRESYEPYNNVMGNNWNIGITDRAITPEQNQQLIVNRSDYERDTAGNKGTYYATGFKGVQIDTSPYMQLGIFVHEFFVGHVFDFAFERVLKPDVKKGLPFGLRAPELKTPVTVLGGPLAQYNNIGVRFGDFSSATNTEGYATYGELLAFDKNYHQKFDTEGNIILQYKTTSGVKYTRYKYYLWGVDNNPFTGQPYGTFEFAQLNYYDVKITDSTQSKRTRENFKSVMADNAYWDSTTSSFVAVPVADFKNEMDGNSAPVMRNPNNYERVSMIPDRYAQVVAVADLSRVAARMVVDTGLNSGRYGWSLARTARVFFEQSNIIAASGFMQRFIQNPVQQTTYGSGLIVNIGTSNRVRRLLTEAGEEYDLGAFIEARCGRDDDVVPVGVLSDYYASIYLSFAKAVRVDIRIVNDAYIVNDVPYTTQINVKAESLVRIDMQQDSNAERLSSVFTEVNGTHVPLTDNTIYRANYGTMIILKMMVSNTYYYIKTDNIKEPIVLYVE